MVNVITRFEVKYVSRARLDSLLARLFPGSGQYSVFDSGEFYEVAAPRLLSQDEIDSVKDIQ